jgi:hypothetical protein
LRIGRTTNSKEEADGEAGDFKSENEDLKDLNGRKRGAESKSKSKSKNAKWKAPDRGGGGTRRQRRSLHRINKSSA